MAERRIPYLKFLFSDKRAAVYWLFIFCALFTGGVLMNGFSVNTLWIVGAFITVYIGFYTVSYYHYCYFFKLEKSLRNDREWNDGIGEIRVFPAPFFSTIPAQNFNIKVRLRAYTDVGYYLCTETSMLLLVPVRELGVFRNYKCVIGVTEKDKSDYSMYLKKKRCVSGKMNRTDQGIEIRTNIGKITMRSLPDFDA